MAIIGTRPETIKMAPVIQHLMHHSQDLETCIVSTAQHRTMLDQVLQVFNLVPDHDFDIMRPGQSLEDITVRVLTALGHLIRTECPDMVLVQGDTTSAFVGGLAAFYNQIPVGHVEAGLRTHRKYDPFPEEMNRHLLDVLADLCFAPTLKAELALQAEGVPPDRILVTGNSGIDALLALVARPPDTTLDMLPEIGTDVRERIVVLTAHRRENLGSPLEQVCAAMADVVASYQDVRIVFPVHLNPKVREIVWPILGHLNRVSLIDPLDYCRFVQLMKRAYLIITDSGGIQEEAPALGKPVLVIRNTTERPEAIEAGTARLIGTRRQDMFHAVCRLLDDPDEYDRMKQAVNPFGDGHAAERIVDEILHFFGLKLERPRAFQPVPYIEKESHYE
jgi:UDP-N-acetylglucosamine 2-epimerase (non-hydrolysing)